MVIERDRAGDQALVPPSLTHPLSRSRHSNTMANRSSHRSSIDSTCSTEDETAEVLDPNLVECVKEWKEVEAALNASLSRLNHFVRQIESFPVQLDGAYLDHVSSCKQKLLSLSPALGMSFSKSKNSTRSPRGLPGIVVSNVTALSAADRTGVKAGDVILSINSVPMMDAMDCVKLISTCHAGDELTIAIQRSNQVTEVVAVLGGKGVDIEEVLELKRLASGPSEALNVLGKRMASAVIQHVDIIQNRVSNVETYHTEIAKEKRREQRKEERERQKEIEQEIEHEISKHEESITQHTFNPLSPPPTVYLKQAPRSTPQYTPYRPSRTSNIDPPLSTAALPSSSPAILPPLLASRSLARSSPAALPPPPGSPSLSRTSEAKLLSSFFSPPYSRARRRSAHSMSPSFGSPLSANRHIGGEASASELLAYVGPSHMFEGISGGYGNEGGRWGDSKGVGRRNSMPLLFDHHHHQQSRLDQQDSPTRFARARSKSIVMFNSTHDFAPLPPPPLVTSSSSSSGGPGPEGLANEPSVESGGENREAGGEKEKKIAEHETATSPQKATTKRERVKSSNDASALLSSLSSLPHALPHSFLLPSAPTDPLAPLSPFDNATEDACRVVRVPLSRGQPAVYALAGDLEGQGEEEEASAPVRLVDYFLAFSVAKEAEPGEVEVKSRRYPVTDYDDFPLPQPSHIARFVLSCRATEVLLDADSSQEELEAPYFFCAVLTDVNGDRIYVSCVHYYLPTAYNPEVYTARCLCLLSRFPFAELFRQCVEELFWQSNRIVDPGAIAPEQMLVLLTREIPLPVPGKCPVGFTLGSRFLMCGIPAQHQLPLLDTDPLKVFQLLSVENFITLFVAVLTEQKIILASHDYGHLQCVAELVLALIFPLRWYHVYVPIVPVDLLAMTEAPVPFLLGFHSDVLPMISAEVMDMAVIVDLDKNQVSLPTATDAPPAASSSAAANSATSQFPTLPEDLLFFLEDSVTECVAALEREAHRPQVSPSSIRRERGGDREEKAGEMEDRSLHAKGSSGTVHGLDLPPVFALRHAFLRVLGNLLNGYNKCLFVLADGVPIFNAEAFLKMPRTPLEPMYAEEEQAPDGGKGNGVGGGVSSTSSGGGRETGDHTRRGSASSRRKKSKSKNYSMTHQFKKMFGGKSGKVGRAQEVDCETLLQQILQSQLFAFFLDDAEQREFFDRCLEMWQGNSTASTDGPSTTNTKHGKRRRKDSISRSPLYAPPASPVFEVPVGEPFHPDMKHLLQDTSGCWVEGVVMNAAAARATVFNKIMEVSHHAEEYLHSVGVKLGLTCTKDATVDTYYGLKVASIAPGLPCDLAGIKVKSIDVLIVSPCPFC